MNDINDPRLPDGSESRNRLIAARSPYLLQHAQNPVHWYEWGSEAFDKASKDNLPVFLSIGYATCHWCHVMAHESFDDKEVADLLNRHFVCIKVDREERPDIDDFYMTVSQVMTGSGGWPLNIFMKADRHPFMAFTYLPKYGRHGMSGFIDLLSNITVLWQQRPDMIASNCTGIIKALADIGRQKPKEDLALAELSRKALHQLTKLFDNEYGGFGSAPKFPMPIYLSWLIEQGSYGNRHSDSMALNTLRRIRYGGIWDHLGGGLHRYSTDREWLAPHFEKMLYDQAMMALVALEAFQRSSDPLYLQVATDIFEFTERELALIEGAYCSALDADSEGVEGKYYLWDKREVDECLGSDSPVFCHYYDVSEKGNFEGRNILNMQSGLHEFCARGGLDQSEIEQTLARCRATLLKRRESRIRPFRDDKIITAWNGLFIAALARGGAISGNLIYVERAAKTASFILKYLRRNDGRLLRNYLAGASDTPAFLEDYACLVLGLVELFEASLDRTWLQEALQLADEMIVLFRDPSDGLFTSIGRDAEQMPVRVTNNHDGVLPSAVFLAAQMLIRLSHICNRPDLLDQARAILNSYVGDLERSTVSHLGALRTMAMLQTEPVTITFCGAIEEQKLSELLAVVWRHPPYSRILMREQESNEPIGVKVCGAGTCYPVISEPHELDSLLRRIISQPE